MTNKKIVYLLFILLNCIYVIGAIAMNEGIFIYSLDDAYIHLSLAKNITEFGIWGVTKYEFSSASSSPIFTVILSSLMKIFGNSQYIILIFNLIISILIIHPVLKINSFLFDNIKIVNLLTIVELAILPLPVMIGMGMEHVLHILVFSYFLVFVLNYLKNKEDFNKILIIAPFLVAIRYESIFFISFFALYLLLNKEIKNAFFIMISSFLLISVFGIYSIIMGGYFFPNSLLMKGNYMILNIENLIFFIKRVLIRLYKKSHYIPLIVSSLLTLYYYNKINKSNLVLKHFSIILFLTIMAMLTFADIGWLFRYESYLVIPIISLLCKGILDFKSNQNYRIFGLNNKTLLIGLYILVSLITFRGLVAYHKAFFAHKNIYEQQIQTSNFIEKFYDKKKIVAFDIGAITYFNDIHLLDYAGLGSTRMVQVIRKGKLDSNFSKSIQNNYNIAIVGTSPNEAVIPSTWNFVGYTEIENNSICAGPRVHFYALKDDINEVKKNFKEFSTFKTKDTKVVISD